MKFIKPLDELIKEIKIPSHKGIAEKENVIITKAIIKECIEVDNWLDKWVQPKM